MKNMYLTRLGWITLSVIIGGILLTIFIVVQTKNIENKIPIEIVALPEDATVELNGVKYTDGSISIQPGTYTVVGYKQGFNIINYTLDITDDNQKIFVLLGGSSSDAQRWVTDNQSKYLKAEAEAGDQISSNTEKLIEKNPIIGKLPYRNYLYKISYKLDPGDDSGQSIILIIDAPEQYRSMAIGKISDLGYDPSSYIYEFTNFTNVFKEANQ